MTIQEKQDAPEEKLKQIKQIMDRAFQLRGKKEST